MDLKFTSKFYLYKIMIKILLVKFFCQYIKKNTIRVSILPRLRWLPVVLAKCYRLHSNIDYFLVVIRMNMKLGYSMFSGLKISKTNKFCKFLLFPSKTIL